MVLWLTLYVRPMSVNASPAFAGQSPRNYSPRRRGLWCDGWQSVADGAECAPAGEAAGGDHGAEVGVDLGAPFRAESVRHSAEDHRGPQRPLALVVGRLDVAARQEYQQLVARRHDNGRPQVAALDIGRLEVQQAIQLAVKAAPMRCDRAVGKIGPPVPDRAGILQERLELWCEDRVAVIDRVLRITDQMGEAELVRLGVCALRRQAIRQPYLRPHDGDKVHRHALA